MSGLCDLHTHSLFSDGTCTPTQIVEQAVRMELGAVALTDHNIVDGLPEFLDAARGKPIEVVLGAEFSADYQGDELHILGLFIQPTAFSQISTLMAEVNREKEESNLRLIEALRRVGVSLDYQAIKAATPRGFVNRANIARAMVKQGYTSTVAEAFDTYLSPKRGLYQEPKRLTAAEVIDLITSIHALPVLAHPFISLTEDKLMSFLPFAKQCGLCGMECYYSEYSTATTQRALQIASEMGLLPSGGSDFHGATKPHISLGKGKGDLCVPLEVYLALKERI